jgi:type IX secretion system PorP/SprF family membrane protein
MLKRFLSACLLAACLQQASAQDIHFSQFFENAALRNPALTGIFSGDYKVSANYRSQWGSFAVPFQTALVSAETKMLLREETGDYLSVGITAVHDKAGSLDFASSSLYGAVNYNKALSEASRSYLSVGLCGGYIQRSFDVSKMRFASQFTGSGYSTAMPTGETMRFEKIQHWDASAGISLNGAVSRNMNYYLGAAGYHVSRPEVSFYDASFVRLTTRWSVNGGLNARLASGFGLVLHANYQYQDPYRELIMGGLISRSIRGAQDGRKITMAAGCFYRYQDAVIPMLQAAYDNWCLTMSYDMTTSSRRMYLNGFGGYELSLSVQGKYKRSTPSPTRCPRFEHDLDYDAYFD